MKTNILFITADQMRADCLGFQGKFPTRTANIDRLAANGVVFDEAYCTSPICVASRAAIMTGHHSFRSGVYYNDQPWPDELATLPGELAKNGYYTVGIGKMQFNPRMRHAGFHKMLNETHLEGHLKGKRPPQKGPSGLSPTPPLSWDEMIVGHYSKKWDENRELDDIGSFYHTSNAVRELEQLVTQRDCTGSADEPFFMWLSLTAPHSPCSPPPPFSDWYRPEDIPPPVKTEEEKQTFAEPLKKFGKGWEALSDELIADFRARYLGEVSVVDHQVGRMVEALERLGLDKNTLIIVSSDHGDYLGDHHLMQKAFFHDPSSKVPLIFHGPGVEQGHVVKQNVSLVDLLPTVLDYCKLLNPSLRDECGNGLYPNSTPPEEAVSLLPALKGGSLPENRVVLAETGIYGQGIMAKINHLKYNYYPQTEELDFFDLSIDPDELDNRGNSLTFEMLPPLVQDAFTKVLTHTAPMHSRRYFYEGKIRPMFT